MLSNYKRNYHPLIPLFYEKGLLNKEQLSQIPKRTQQHWNNNKYKNYDFNEWVVPFTKELNTIQKTYERKFLRKTIRTIIKISDGYHKVLNTVSSRKKILAENSESIVKAIDVIIAETSVKTKRACKLYGVSKDWYYREKRKVKCSLNIFKKCFKQHPNQLTFEEVQAIENLIKVPEHYGKTIITLYYHALRNSIVSCGKSTFYKYTKALGYKKAKKSKSPYKKGVRATRIFEWLHIDITLVPTLEDGTQKVAFVKDNFSKAILHYGSVTKKADSSFITKLFKETFKKFNLYDEKHPINILTDGGPENKGVFTKWVNHFNTPPIVTKITAKTTDFPLSNSMAESTHSIYKTEFLKGKISKNNLIHLQNLDSFVTYYNHTRYPNDLLGLTPMEVIEGSKPDKNRYKEQINEAKLLRIQKNKTFNQCVLINTSNK